MSRSSSGHSSRVRGRICSPPLCTRQRPMRRALKSPAPPGTASCGWGSGDGGAHRPRRRRFSRHAEARALDRIVASRCRMGARDRRAGRHADSQRAAARGVDLRRLAFGRFPLGSDRSARQLGRRGQAFLCGRRSRAQAVRRSRGAACRRSDMAVGRPRERLSVGRSVLGVARRARASNNHLFVIRTTSCERANPACACGPEPTPGTCAAHSYALIRS